MGSEVSRKSNQQPTPAEALGPGVDGAAEKAERWIAQALDRVPLAVATARAVAEQVQSIGLGVEGVAAAWVCGAAPQFNPPLSDVKAQLGEPVAALVDAVRRVSSVRWQRLEDERTETLRKAFLAMARDIRGVIIALALRLQELRATVAERAPLSDPGRATPAELERARSRGPELELTDVERAFAEETLDVHASLANRLGVWQLKWPLEDNAFRLLQPDTYQELSRLLAESRERRENYVSEVVGELKAQLERAGLQARVTGRPKHIYSVYRKMERKQVSFEQIYDLSAVRVITSRVQDCYAVLGLVHSLWVPIPHELDDYVAMPKSNGYQSLHTAVIGPRGRAVEIQIRTEEMHRFAEYGVAAHWAYKEGQSSEGLAKRFTLLRQLMDMDDGPKSDPGDAEALADTLRAILFTDQVFVFTPKGDVVELPDGSTPLDFAYRVHTEIGHRCKGARVNDQIAPLDSKLRTGDRVEILTQRESSPSRDWLTPGRGFLTNGRARAKVRAWFREREPERPPEPPRSLRDAPKEQQTPEPVLPPAVLHDFASAPAAEPPRPARGIVLDDVTQVLGQRAQCCQPLPGDAVVGFITRGRGLTLHRKDCAQVEALREPERWVEVRWGGNDAPQGVELQVTLRDDTTAFSSLVARLAQLGVHLSAANRLGSSRGELRWRLRLDLTDAEHERRVLVQLRSHPGVIDIRRSTH
jgi:GTP pyrophosphokinase